MSLDDSAKLLVAQYDRKGMDAAALRFDGDTIAVICGNTQAAITLMRKALEQLTAPVGGTKH